MAARDERQRPKQTASPGTGTGTGTGTSVPSGARGGDGSAVRKVLITGVSGGLGRLLVRRLLDETEGQPVSIVGVANAPYEGSGRNRIEFHELDLTKKKVEDLFRRGDVDSVVHLAFEDDPRVPSAERYKINVLGTMRLLDWCEKYGVGRVVVLSTASVYGALPDNPTHIQEESPIRGDLAYPGLRDRVETDRYAQAWMWRTPKVQTFILRPCHVIGPLSSSGLKLYLRLKVVPVLLGFDPLIQLIHEDDVARALHLALDAMPPVAGIYNVVGPCAVPLREVLREVGAEVFPIPHVGGLAALRALWALGIAPFPAPQADFVRYPLVCSGSKIRKDLGFVPEVTLKAALRAAAGRWA